MTAVGPPGPTVDRNGLEILEHEECLRLLGSAAVGRVGLTVSALPVVLPVNFWFDGDDVFIRTTAGSKLEAAMRGAVVAFEVDHFDPVDHTGWSVVVTGRTRTVVDDPELERLAHAPLARWAPLGHERFIAIDPQLVSGRRIHPGHP